ncbi:MAG: bifunctional ADP-dependent (S)-NAD(P)H-hydrate dehydratase/NAD(P)H-hydrate epimerase, partial [Propionibacteriaceae bacterium]|nr:bifunctional ADP-dependent (S)-NAD(P)H-hydrate dehydratase/NAD(P)H-hydrate epimerase [Propionibacteriaceae bacterium]
MDEAYAVAPIRDAEQAAIAAVGEDALMQRAARGLADVIAEHLSRTRGGVAGARIVLLAGPGNNGGDGLFAAARLAGLGATVQVWRSQEQVHAAGWRTLLDAGGMQLGGDAEAGAAAIADADVVVDALLGIGGRPGL